MSGIILLGTGPSCAIPQIHHVLNTLIHPRPGVKYCKICKEASENVDSLSRRDNVSALVVLDDGIDPKQFILIDIGKTFRNTVLRWFVKYCVTQVLITHGHADALGGMDDIRDIQGGFILRTTPEGNLHYHAAKKLPVFLSEETYLGLRKAFPYIKDVNVSSDIAENRLRVGEVVGLGIFLSVICQDFRICDPSPAKEVPMISKIAVKVFPVFHGGSYICSGYIFGQGTESLVYISDVSEFPLETLELIDNAAPFKVLVIDALFTSMPHFSHLCVTEVLDFVERWRPTQTYIVGFSCRDDWRNVNQILKDEVVPDIARGIPRCKLRNVCTDFEHRIQKTRELLAKIPIKPEIRKAAVESIEIAVDGTFIGLDFFKN